MPSENLGKWLMTGKRKKRFVVKFGKSKRLLFTAEERPDQSLLLYMRHAKYSEQREGKVLNRQYRFSIHPSHDSSNSLVVAHHELDNGQYEKAYTTISGGKDKIIFPIISVQSPNLANQQYDLKQDVRDEIISVFEFPFTVKSTFCYGIIVSNSQKSLPYMKYFNTTYYDFSYFRLNVVYRFLNLPAIDAGQTLAYATKRTIGQSPPSLEDIESMETVDPAQLDEVLHGMFDMVSLSMIKKRMELEPQKRQFFQSYKPIFSILPPEFFPTTDVNWDLSGKKPTLPNIIRKRTV